MGGGSNRPWSPEDYLDSLQAIPPDAPLSDEEPDLDPGVLATVRELAMGEVAAQSEPAPITVWTAPGTIED